MTSYSTWSFSALLRSWICPSMDRWRELQCSNCMSLPLHLDFMSLQLTMCSKSPTLFLAGNSTPTPPHSFSRFKGSSLPVGCADSAAADGRRGSNVYEVNHWLWKFGHGKPRLGGLTVDETAMRKNTVREENSKQVVETRRRRRADGA